MRVAKGVIKATTKQRSWKRCACATPDMVNMAEGTSNGPGGNDASRHQKRHGRDLLGMKLPGLTLVRQIHTLKLRKESKEISS